MTKTNLPATLNPRGLTKSPVEPPPNKNEMVEAMVRIRVEELTARRDALNTQRTNQLDLYKAKLAEAARLYQDGLQPSALEALGIQSAKADLQKALNGQWFYRFLFDVGPDFEARYKDTQRTPLRRVENERALELLAEATAAEAKASAIYQSLRPINLELESVSEMRRKFRDQLSRTTERIDAILENKAARKALTAIVHDAVAERGDKARW